MELRAGAEGEWSLRQGIQRRDMNEQVRGGEGTTWKLVVGTGGRTGDGGSAGQTRAGSHLGHANQS